MMIPPRTRSLLQLASALSFSLTLASAQNFDAPLAPANGFNLMVFQGATLSNTDSEGRVAVGGNANFTNYGVGNSLAGTPAQSGNSLVVGGNLTYNGGEVHYGNVVYGGSLSGGPSVPNGTLSRGSVLNFSSIRNQLVGSSDLLSQVASNSSMVDDGGRIVLTGTDSELNVFNVSGSILSGAWGISIDAPSASTVLVNVDGLVNDVEYVDFRIIDSNGLGTTNAQHILFNFYETTQLSIAGVGMSGSVLAPHAAVSFNWAQLEGQLIANSLNGTGEVHNKLFAGDLSAASGMMVPEPSTALLCAFGLLALFRRRR